jgi:hypothetical protein
MRLSGNSILSDRERLTDLLRATLSARIPKTSGRAKTLSEVHSSVCSVVRDLSKSSFYVSTEFSSKERHVAAALLCKTQVCDCICVNIDTPEIAEPVDIEVWLCS